MAGAERAFLPLAGLPAWGGVQARLLESLAFFQIQDRFSAINRPLWTARKRLWRF